MKRNNKYIMVCLLMALPALLFQSCLKDDEKVYGDNAGDRVEKFLVNYESVGKALENALKAYGEGHKKLEPGGQSIVKTASKLVSMGARKSKMIE